MVAKLHGFTMLYALRQVDRVDLVSFNEAAVKIIVVRGSESRLVRFAENFDADLRPFSRKVQSFFLVNKYNKILPFGSVRRE